MLYWLAYPVVAIYHSQIHYENMPMQYTVVKNENFNIFLIFAQNIDCGYSLEQLAEAFLTSTHNLCLGT